MKIRREEQRETGTAGFPERCPPRRNPVATMPRGETGEEEVINMAHTHTYAHMCTHKHTLAAIRRRDCIRIHAEPAGTVTLTALLHFNFLTHTHTHAQIHSILNS